jgi:hypothetical protein
MNTFIYIAVFWVRSLDIVYLGPLVNGNVVFSGELGPCILAWKNTSRMLGCKGLIKS